MVNRSDVMHTITMRWLSGALEVIDSFRFRERKRRFLSTFSFSFFSSFRPFPLVGAGVWLGSNKNESDGRSFATGCTTTSVTRQLEKTLNENKWDQTRGDEGFSFFCFLSFSSSFFGEAGTEPFCVFWMRWVGGLVSFDVVHLFVAASDPLHLLIDHLSCLLNCRCCCFFKRKKKKSSRPK